MVTALPDRTLAPSYILIPDAGLCAQIFVATPLHGSILLTFLQLSVETNSLFSTPYDCGSDS